MTRPTKKEMILQELTLAIHMTQANYPEDITDAMVQKLAAYPEPAVIQALQRCQIELGKPLMFKDILDRIDDGRPGPEEAWALIPRDEYKTVVWNNEIAKAWGVAKPTLDAGDKIGARMAFLEAYKRIVAKARAAGTVPHWMPSLGYDPHGREDVLLAAAKEGLLPLSHVQALLPDTRITPDGERLLHGANLKLTGKAKRHG